VVSASQKGGSVLSQKEASNVVANPSLDVIKRRDQILDLPSQIFSRYRLILLAALWREGELDFKQLLEDVPQISEGNLSSHLRTLENLGVIDVNKEFVKKRPKSSYKLNKKGRKLIEEIADRLLETFDDIR